MFEGSLQDGDRFRVATETNVPFLSQNHALSPQHVHQRRRPCGPGVGRPIYQTARFSDGLERALQIARQPHGIGDDTQALRSNFVGTPHGWQYGDCSARVLNRLGKEPGVLVKESDVVQYLSRSFPSAGGIGMGRAPGHGPPSR
jgi:hypothetical protein